MINRNVTQSQNNDEKDISDQKRKTIKYIVSS